MPRLKGSEDKNKLLVRTISNKLTVLPLQNILIFMVCHWEVRTLFLPDVDALRLLLVCCLGGGLDQAFFLGWKKTVKKERKKKGMVMPVKNTWERTGNCSCFATAICCLLFTFFRLSPFPEISHLPRYAMLPLLPPAGCACCLPTGQIYHPKSVSERFLLLAAWEGVLFALPKCSQGLMLRCYVQTISTVMNHVLPPLCFYFCTRCFFPFWANTLEFPCLLLTQCMSGTRHRLSYSYRPTADMIRKSTSRSRSRRPFLFPTTKGKLIQHSLK